MIGRHESLCKLKKLGAVHIKHAIYRQTHRGSLQDKSCGEFLCRERGAMHSVHSANILRVASPWVSQLSLPSLCFMLSSRSGQRVRNGPGEVSHCCPGG